jgi:hypothetical protein
MFFSPGEATFAGRDETAVIAKPLGNQHTPGPNEWPMLEACPAHAWRIRKTGTTIPQCISRRSFLASHLFQQALNFSPANGIYTGKLAGW